jgi:hypothetical protein
MNRKFKAVGLALVAVFAMSAMIASPASATEFTAAKYTTTFHGEQPAGQKHVFEVNGANVECNTATFSGQIAGPTTNLTVTPNYGGAGGCTAFGLNATVTVPSTCDFVFHTEASGLNGTVDVECTGAPITIDTALNTCNTHVASQTGLKGVSYKNNGEHVDVDAKVTGITATVTGTFLCPVVQKTETYKNASYTGTVTVKGNNKIDVG